MKNKGEVASEPLHIRVSPSTLFKLQSLAERDKRTLSGYVRWILDTHIEIPTPENQDTTSN